MDEHEDQFYDSLDEMPELQSKPSNATRPAEEGSTSCLFLSDVTEAESCISNRPEDEDDDVSSMIPLYGGEVPKNGKKRGARRVTRKPKSLMLLEKSEAKKAAANSYLALFYSRIGYSSDRNKKPIPDSARAVDGDLTQRTVGEAAPPANPEVFEDAQQVSADDTESFYENILRNASKPEIKTTRSSNTMRSFTTTSLTTDSVMQLHSVSERVLYTPGDAQSKRSKGKKKDLPPDPVVSRLGPDIVAMKGKLENWKRRQSYGLTASEKNMIKLKESRILKELKAEETKGKKASSE